MKILENIKNRELLFYISKKMGPTPLWLWRAIRRSKLTKVQVFESLPKALKFLEKIKTRMLVYLYYRKLKNNASIGL